MRLLLLVPIFFFISCRKEKKDDLATPLFSERFLLLTQHRWTMTHDYRDSSAYAKANLNLWPLSTTEDRMDYSDTCSWDSELLFLPDGKWKTKKSVTCDPSISEYIGQWKLANSDQDFVSVGADTFHIVELTQHSFKMYYKQYTWVQGQLVSTTYCMWTFAARS